ncbi:MAG: tripartite tricarboxylate transporter substrate-binding protein [Devosia sp.]
MVRGTAKKGRVIVGLRATRFRGKFSFDPLKEFAPVSLTSLSPMVLVTHPSVPAKDLREFIAYAKKNPRKLEFGSAGASSFGRMATELFSRRAGVEMLHVPYQGAAQTTQALVQGDIKVLISTLTAPLVSFEKEGRVRFLGAATEKPNALLPGVPLIGEVLPGFKTEVWSGIVAPAGTPADVIARLQDAMTQALALPEVRERYATIGLTPTSSTPQEFTERLRKEYAEWGAVIREANIKAD